MNREPVYAVHYVEQGTEPQEAHLSGVVVQIRATNALLAIERANEYLNNMPKEKRWFVLSVGPVQAFQPAAAEPAL